MKPIAPDTLHRLTCIAAGSAGSQGEISLRTSDLVELKEASSGNTLKSLDSIDDSNPGVMIPVPLLIKALQEVAPSVLSFADAEPTSSKKSHGKK